MPKMTAEAARKLLDVRPAIPVAFTTKSGKLLDEDGDELDGRQTVPWVWALGPFGSWPCTLEDAEKDFAAHPEWYDGESMRVGYSVVYRQGWGYAATRELPKPSAV